VSTHSWIGPFGATLRGLFFWLSAWPRTFFRCCSVFGAAYLFNFLGYLVQRSRWSVLWAAVLVMSLTGLLHMMDGARIAGGVRLRIGAPFFGGYLGYVPYEYLLWMLGSVGAIIINATLCLISLLFLTNFRLGDWLRGSFGAKPGPRAEHGGNCARTPRTRVEETGREA
jgi:hypothetical protein